MHQQGFIQTPGPIKSEATHWPRRVWLLGSWQIPSETPLQPHQPAQRLEVLQSFKKSVGKKLLTNNRCPPHSFKMISLFGAFSYSLFHAAKAFLASSLFSKTPSKYLAPKLSMASKKHNGTTFVLGTHIFGKLSMIPHEVHYFEQCNWGLFYTNQTGLWVFKFGAVCPAFFSNGKTELQKPPAVREKCNAVSHKECVGCLDVLPLKTILDWAFFPGQSKKELASDL